MKAVILAGGYGTRLSEETAVRPKPLVEIGEQPILWHIMQIYSAHGIHEFIICCGYKGHLIKEYFANYFLHRSDLTFDIRKNAVEVHQNHAEPWRVTVVDTGCDTMTGGRLKRVKDYIGEQTFCFTYGDGVSDVDLSRLIAFHREQGGLATLTAVQPPGRFGAFMLEAEQTHIGSFKEKPKGDADGAWINGGFFVLEPAALDYIADDATSWEQEPLQCLAQEGKLCAYRHDGFWHPMDTLKDKKTLDALWTSGQAPWKIWSPHA
jgi:glucose-1-phosphate cytidylyltransferase